MDANRKAIRGWLRNCTRQDLDWAMFDANLTDRQREIVELTFSKGLSAVAISMRCHIDPSVVKVTLQSAYDKLSKVVIL